MSSFLYDRMAGRGGLVSRLGEYGEFKSRLENAIKVPDCPERCHYGCPACILRPDMYFEGGVVDRTGALELSRKMVERLQVPQELQVFGARRAFSASRCVIGPNASVRQSNCRN